MKTNKNNTDWAGLNTAQQTRLIKKMMDDGYTLEEVFETISMIDDMYYNVYSKKDI